jgi:hypothetical protein
MATESGPLFPFNDPISEKVGGKQLVQFRWRRWFLRLREAVDNAAVAIPVPPVLNASASQPVTSMDGGALSAGLYSVGWYLPIVTTEAGSTAQVTIAWVDLGVSKSYVATAVDGSVANNTQPDVRLLIYSDAASPITYAVTYVGATMVYSFRPVLQSTSS